MSGVLSGGRDTSGASVSKGSDSPAPPGPATTESVIVDPLSIDPQSLVQLSLWKRVLAAAEREFERDDTPERLQDLPPQPASRTPAAGDRKKDER